MPPPHPSRLAPRHLPLIGEGFGAQKTENLPAKRCSLTSSGCTFYLQQIFNRNCSRIWCPVSGGAYQDAREVSIEWNARPKYWDLPKIRCSMHPASPRTLFSPIFSLAREKMGPSETRQKRPRRNESLQARLLILCARFFLSKPQTEFAVWVFLCKSVTTSQALRASSPGRGAFPPDRGNRPFTQGSLRAYSASPPSGPKRAVSQVWQRPTQAWTAREAASTSRVATDMPWRPDSNRWHSHATP